MQKIEPKLGGEKEFYKITVDISRHGTMNAISNTAIAPDCTRNGYLSQLYAQFCRNNVQEEMKQMISSLQVHSEPDSGMASPTSKTLNRRVCQE